MRGSLTKLQRTFTRTLSTNSSQVGGSKSTGSIVEKLRQSKAPEDGHIRGDGHVDGWPSTLTTDPGAPHDSIQPWQKFIKYTSWVAVLIVGSYTIFEGPVAYEDGQSHVYTEPRTWWANKKKQYGFSSSQQPSDPI